MGTRSIIVVHDKDEKKGHCIYRHWDGYPESIIPDLELALPYAWPLPRFEADEFAASIVAAWKKPGDGKDLHSQGGNIRLSGEIELKDRFKEGDSRGVDYSYVVTEDEGKVRVSCFNSDDEKVWEGILGVDKYPEKK